MHNNTESKLETWGGDLKLQHVEMSRSRDSSVEKNIGEDAISSAEISSLEASIRRKLDWHLLPLCILIHLSAQIDRSNMGNARIMGMAEDIQLTGNRFNIALTAFFTTYIFFEM